MREPPKPYHHGDLRNALIQAGLDVLASGGAAALDMRQVARKVGVSSAAPYRHFADRQALIAVLLEEGFHRLAQAIRHARNDAPDEIFAQLRAVARAYVHFAQNNPWLVRDMFSSATIHPAHYPATYQASKQVYGLYMEVIQRGQDQGRIRAGEPSALAGVFWSLLHGIAILIIDDQMHPYADGSEGIDRITELSLQVLYHGLEQV